MSAWRLVVRELYERGPLRAAQMEPATEPYSALQQATHLGLVVPHGRGGHIDPPPYRLTPQGEDWACGRLQVVIRTFGARGPGGGRMPGTCRVLRPTWLSALPRPNDIRLAK